MNRGEGTSLIATHPRGGLSLTPKEREFCEQYFAGEEHAGNATRSYLQIHPSASYATASVEASELLKQPKIRAYLNELQEQAIRETAESMMPWSELLPAAQSVVVATAQGRIRNRLAFEASVYLINRVMGSPTSTSEVHVVNHERIAKAIGAFSRRFAEVKQREVVHNGTN